MTITRGKTIFAVAVMAAFCGSSANAVSLESTREVSCVFQTEVEYTRNFDAPLEEAWSIISSAEGLESFLAPKVVLEPEPGGLFEAHIFPDNPAGQRGLEGRQVLAYEPMARVMFTWSVPSHVAAATGPQQSVIEFSVSPVGDHQTRITGRQLGLGRGDAWATAPAYHKMRFAWLFSNLTEFLSAGETNWDDWTQKLISESKAFEESLADPNHGEAKHADRCK